jgi:hypothetical protein
MWVESRGLPSNYLPSTGGPRSRLVYTSLALGAAPPRPRLTRKSCPFTLGLALFAAARMAFDFWQAIIELSVSRPLFTGNLGQVALLRGPE